MTATRDTPTSPRACLDALVSWYDSGRGWARQLDLSGSGVVVSWRDGDLIGTHHERHEFLDGLSGWHGAALAAWRFMRDRGML